MKNRWLRLLINNKVNSIGIFVIILLTVLLGTMFLETNQNLNDSVALIKKGDVQDISFYPNITENELIKYEFDYEKAIQSKNDELAETYHFVWEQRAYKMYKADEKIYRIYSCERTIDQIFLTSGKEPQKDEILVDYKYAGLKDLNIGDYFMVDNKSYRISGFCIFPDQLYPIPDNTGIQYDPESQALLALGKEDYDRLELSEDMMYVGRFTDGRDLVSEMQDDKDFFYITAASDNVQIDSTVRSQKNMNSIIMGFSMGVLGCIAVLLVIITITQQINSEQPHLGVLKALGYTNVEVSAKYLGYFIIIFLAAVIGYLAGHLLTPVFYSLLCSKFHIPFINDHINIINMIIFCIAPSLMITLLAFLTSVMKVKRPALHLIKNMKVKKNGILVKARNRKVTDKKYLKGVRKVILFSNLLLFVFILFGGFALGVQIQFAYTTYNMTSNISDSVLSGADYNAEVRYIKDIEDGSMDSDNYYFYTMSGRLGLPNGEKSKLYDIKILEDGNTDMLKLYDKNEKLIDIGKEDGIVINSLMALQNNLSIGDTVQFINGDMEVDMQISNISRSVYGTTVYVGQKEAFESGLLDEEVYNGMYTDKELDFDSDMHLSITRVENIRETLEQSTEVNRIMSIMLFLCGLIIGTTVLLLAIFGVISSYKKYIAIMKIYGYSEKECSYAVLDGFRGISIIGFLISIPYTYLLATIMFSWISMTSDMIYPVEFNLQSVIVCFLLTMAITEIIIRITKRKVTGISFKEVMEH